MARLLNIFLSRPAKRGTCQAAQRGGRWVPAQRLALVVVIVMVWGVVAEAQLQGVQPIFNDQLGGWSAIHPKRAPRPPGNSPPGQGGGAIIQPWPPYWGYDCWGPPGYPYCYPTTRPYFAYDYFGGWRNWSVATTQPIQPVIVVQPQIIVMPPAAGGNVPPQPIGALPPMAANRAGPLPPETEIARRVGVLKASTEAGRTRADQLIAEGDREFASGVYRRAAMKYRDAINRAPDYATAYFRAGHAYIANGDYELAVTYFSMALELARTADRAGFSLETLYRGDDAAKQDHLAKLTVAAARQPLEGGLPFLTGITLYYDGNPLKAREHFRRSSDLPGRHRPYTALFLPPELNAAPEQPAAQ